MSYLVKQKGHSGWSISPDCTIKEILTKRDYNSFKEKKDTTFNQWVEAPRSQLPGIFDPQIEILFFMLANPAASRGECARGDSSAFLLSANEERINRFD